MPRRKQTCPKRMKYDGKEPPEGAENGEAVEGEEGDECSDCSGSDGEGGPDNSPSPPSLDPRPDTATTPESPASADNSNHADIKTDSILKHSIMNHIKVGEAGSKAREGRSDERLKRPYSMDETSDLYKGIPPSPEVDRHRHNKEGGREHRRGSVSPKGMDYDKPLVDKHRDVATPPSLPQSDASSSILDKLASFTNGSSASSGVGSSSKSKYDLGMDSEESAISKLSNFVKDPGKLMSKDPIRLKVPTPPLVPSSYQFNAAMAASYLHPSMAAAAAAAAAVAMSATGTKGTSTPPLTSTTTSSTSSSSTAAPASDQDQPLDLSVKAKGLDLSTKSPNKERGGKMQYVSADSPVEREIFKTASESGLSSLRTLEQKFGSNAFAFDGRSSFKSQLYRHPHPMMPAFGGNLYTAALFNTPPLATTDQIYRPDQSPRSGSSHHHQASAAASHSPRRHGNSSSSERVPPSSVTPSRHDSSSGEREKQHKVGGVSSSSFHSPAKSSSSIALNSSRESSAEPSAASLSALAAGASPANCKDKKHTNLSCQCGKDYTTLYELTLHLRESGHVPNNKGGVQPEYPKLVRGQDMWLNQGSEQTRQILRCMQCGESFKSLPELTVHMIETKHYTNIVGTEASTLSRKQVMKLTSSDSGSDSDVFKCQVCESTFDNMDGLTSHIMTSGHHKRPVIIQPESPAAPQPPKTPTSASDGVLAPPEQQSPRSAASSPSAAFKRAHSPMSLSLLEYKYKLAKLAAEHRAANAEVGEQQSRDSSSPGSDFLAEISKITCETCGDRIEMGKFVEHVRACVGKLSLIKHNKANGMDALKIKLKEMEAMDLRDFKEFSKSFKEKEMTSGKRRRNADGEGDDEEFDRETVPVKKEKRDSSCESSSPRSPASSHRPNSATSDEARLLGGRDTAAANGPTPSPSGKTDSGSALKAMESFIERSFTSVNSHNRNRYFPFKGPVRNSFFNAEHQIQPLLPETRASDPVNLAARGTPEKERHHGGIFSNKYLPPLYVHPDHMENHNNNRPKSRDSKDSNKSKDKRPESRSSTPGITSVKVKKEKIDREDVLPKAPEVVKRVEENTPVSAAKVKYLQEEEDAKSNGDSKSSVSALESLQGLVYGKSFNSEHPLDSLQKLIGPSNNLVPQEKQNGSHILPPPPNQQPMPGNNNHKAGTPPSAHHSPPITSAPPTQMVLQANVTLLAASSPSPRAPSASPTPSLSPRQPGTPTFHRGSVGTPNSNPGSPLPPSKMSERGGNPSNSDGERGAGSEDEGQEYKCSGCKRLFVSKGSYRYHMSRCHLSSLRKLSRSSPSPTSNGSSAGSDRSSNGPGTPGREGSKEGKPGYTSPYVYLPLDHTAKFNKYYEMANELANKSK